MQKNSLLKRVLLLGAAFTASTNTLYAEQTEPNIETAPLNLPTKKTNKMRILLTNDDGCDSFGILELQKQLEAQDFDVWLVAPTNNQSAIGTAITFKPNKVISFTQPTPKTFCFPGTPSDAVDFALLGLLKESPPDLIISGVNDGPNTGIAQLNSGTVAAAVRALRYGYPAIAASIGVIPEEINHYFPSTTEFWPDSVNYIADLIQHLNSEWIKAKQLNPNALVLPKGTGLSINYPARAKEQIKGIKYVANEFNAAPQLTYSLISHNETIQRLNPVILKQSSTATDTGYLDQGYITYTVIDGNWNANNAIPLYEKLIPTYHPIQKKRAK